MQKLRLVIHEGESYVHAKDFIAQLGEVAEAQEANPVVARTIRVVADSLAQAIAEPEPADSPA